MTDRSVKYKKLAAVAAAVLFAAGACPLAACGNGVEYSENNFGRIEDYGFIETTIVSEGNISLYIDETLGVPRAEAERMFAGFKSDYGTLNDAFGRNTRVAVIILGNADFGAAGCFCEPEIAYCSPESFESGDYLAALSGAYLKESDPWKGAAVAGCIFGAFAEDEEQLARFYSREENLPVLTLFAAYFCPDFASWEQIEAALSTAASLGSYIVSEHGFEALGECASPTEYRAEWLQGLGSGADFSPPYDLSWLGGAEYEFTFGEYPLIISTADRTYSISAASGLDAGGLLGMLSSGNGEAQRIMEYIKNNATQAYAGALERFGRQADYFISGGGSSYTDTGIAEVYLYDDEFIHETVHLITLEGAQSDGVWLAEGVAEYFSREFSSVSTARAQRIYNAFLSYSGEGDALPGFIAEVRQMYSEAGGSFGSFEEFDFALIERCIACATFSEPGLKDRLGSEFPFAAMSVGYYAPVASPTEANGLTYPECYLFTRWLIENYGLDAVLLCCSGYDFERYFGGSFEQVFSAFLQSI